MQIEVIHDLDRIRKFNGSIETIDSYLENGQRIIAISGRNNYSKLLSPAVNKNTLHLKKEYN